MAVVMRSHNDMPLAAETLAALSRQRVPLDLIVLDNASTDGTREVAEQYARTVEGVPAGTYVPGRVLNRAMQLARSDVVAFLNADCTPQTDDWLETLVAPFAEPRVAATYGRQVPRPGCHPLFARDTAFMFGSGERARLWRHAFSMANAAIRRTVWQAMPFDESLRYSEDVDWTWRARQKGYDVRYVPASVAMHSHNYTLRRWYGRQRGEGEAEARILTWSAWDRSLVRYSLLPYARQVLADWRWCAARGAPSAAAYSPVLRMAQMLGRRAGFRDGWRQRETGS